MDLNMHMARSTSRSCVAESTLMPCKEQAIWIGVAGLPLLAGTRQVSGWLIDSTTPDETMHFGGTR